MPVEWAVSRSHPLGLHLRNAILKLEPASILTLEVSGTAIPSWESGFIMPRWRRQFLLFPILTIAWGTAVQAQDVLNNVPAQLVGYPDLAVYNTKIMTMNDASLSSNVGQQVQAMAIRGDRILATGADDAMLRLAGPQTRRIDLKGRTVVPGMFDTHSHMREE